MIDFVHRALEHFTSPQGRTPARDGGRRVKLPTETHRSY
jgi:hypothetical protein